MHNFDEIAEVRINSLKYDFAAISMPDDIPFLGG